MATSYRVAARELADRDPVIARLVAETGWPRFPRPTDTHFATLVQSIVYQQLAGAAARAIHGRLVAALGGEVTPERVLATDAEALRAVGLSHRKVESLLDLAGRVADGRIVLDPRRVARMGDEDIITRLSEVRGIGRWSAQMFLIVQLRRLDVWPTGDLAVRKGYGLGWQVPVPTPKQLEALGDHFRPYRTVAAWYCWTAAERYGRQKVALPV
jgi:DNA-3-methyladenine glycosylase II